MNKFLSLAVLACGIHGNIFASGNFCTKCEKNREYNRTHPSKYTFYEDYLKDTEENVDEEEPNGEIDFTSSDNPEKKTQNKNIQQKNKIER